MTDKRVITHGRTGYSAYGCRCEICKEASRVYSKAYREAKLKAKAEQAAVNKADSPA